MTRKEKRNAPARPVVPNTPEVRAEILRLLRTGCTLSEICDRPDMPPIATFFYWRSQDVVFGKQCADAMAEHAEALISDAMEQSVAAVDAAYEPVEGPRVFDVARAKAADQYLQAALKYAGAIAPHKYGSLVKLADAQVGNGIQISITSYAPNGGADGGGGAQDTGEAPQVPCTPGP